MGTVKITCFIFLNNEDLNLLDEFKYIGKETALKDLTIKSDRI